MKVLVTGGAGFIGSHVVEFYLANKYQVLVVDNLSTGQRQNIPAGAEFCHTDLVSGDIGKILKDYCPDIINHHAGHIHVPTSIKNPAYDAQQNIIGALNLLTAAQEVAEVKNIIFASSGGAVYGETTSAHHERMKPNPLSPYGLAKLTVERYIRLLAKLNHWRFSILRYSNVYGPRQSRSPESGVIALFTKAMLSLQSPIIYGDGSQSRDFVYVEDVAAANLLVTENPVDDHLNISSNNSTTILDLWSILEKAGRNLKKEKLPPPEYLDARPGEIYFSRLSNRKARQYFNWQPKISLEKGIEKTINYYHQK